MDQTPLVYQRIAAHVLATVFKEYGINQLAHKFVADDDGHWVVVHDGEVRVIREHKVIGIILFSYGDDACLPTSARITINDVYAIVRDGHYDDFEANNYGIVVKSARDWKGDIEPDIDVTLHPQDLESAIVSLHGRRRKLPTTPLLRKPKIKGGLSFVSKKRT